MKLRALSGTGLQEFADYLSSLREDATAAPPCWLLDGMATSVDLNLSSTIDIATPFESKAAFASYLHEHLGPEIESRRLHDDVGVWSWLSLAFFDVVCPQDARGLRTPGAVDRHILSREFKRRYRHLVRTPFLIRALHGDVGNLILLGAPDVHGEFLEQLASRTWLWRSRGTIEALCQLYVDADQNRFKRGAASKTGGGTSRRFGKVMKQFDLTHDVAGLDAKRLGELLPAEFSRFRK